MQMNFPGNEHAKKFLIKSLDGRLAFEIKYSLFSLAASRSLRLCFPVALFRCAAVSVVSNASAATVVGTKFFVLIH